MKILFDENLSPRLIHRLTDLFPESAHVISVGLEGHADAEVWLYAREKKFTIVSKDNDFRQRAFLMGAPPKVIWLQIGNAGTAAVELLLRREFKRICKFETNTDESLLVLDLFTRPYL